MNVAVFLTVAVAYVAAEMAVPEACMRIASADFQCPGCNDFCNCLKTLAPNKLISEQKMDAAYEKCDPDIQEYEDDAEEGSGAPDTLFDDKWDKYTKCITPRCSRCQNMIDSLAGIEPAKSGSKTFVRRRRRRAAGPQGSSWKQEMDKIDTCVAKELGMSLAQLRRYEERYGIAEMGSIPCYLLSCGQTYDQMESQDKACRTKHGITSEEFYDYDYSSENEK